MAVKNVIAKTWHLLPGGDNRLRSADRFGLVGRAGIREDDFQSTRYQTLLAAAIAIAVEEGINLEDIGGLTLVRDRILRQIQAEDLVAKMPFPVLFAMQIVDRHGKVPDGEIVTATSVAWWAIWNKLQNDPRALHEFAQNPRAFEEFIAGAYDLAGFDEVILTPRKGDHGRDVIAEKKGFFAIRVLDQAKAYSPGRVVTHDDVRAMVGVLHMDQAASKAVITTTSEFAPMVREPSQPYASLMPTRLELKDGKELVQWLATMKP
jgi:restriction system protein